jgi:hypothetical protein
MRIKDLLDSEDWDSDLKIGSLLFVSFSVDWLKFYGWKPGVYLITGKPADYFLLDRPMTSRRNDRRLYFESLRILLDRRDAIFHVGEF